MRDDDYEVINEVVGGWPGKPLHALRKYCVKSDYNVNLAEIDSRLAGRPVGRLVPLLVVWLQQLEERIAAAEAACRAPPPPPPPSPLGWYTGWAPFIGRM